MRLAAAALLGLATSTATDPPKLDMTAFFAGNSHADNVIKIAFHGPHKLIVDSVGGRNKEGEFVLVDTVREEGKPVRTRTWVMQGDGRMLTNHVVAKKFGLTFARVDGTIRKLD